MQAWAGDLASLILVFLICNVGILPASRLLQGLIGHGNQNQLKVRPQFSSQVLHLPNGGRDGQFDVST